MKEDVSGLVLDRNPSGESGFLIKIFSRERGLVVMYKRVSAKKTTLLPDIFDEISAETTAAKNSDLLFLGDFDTLKRRRMLAVDYGRFGEACHLSKLLAKNARYLEHFSEAYDALSGALDALLKGACISVVRIKFIYVFARAEGYAAKESFAKNLSAEDFLSLSKILSSPALECPVTKIKSERILAALEHWLYSSTDILPA